MEKDKIIELQNKIIEGLKISASLFLEEKKRKNDQIIISENGVIKIVDARSL